MDQPEIPPEALLIRRARQARGLSPERIVKEMRRLPMSGRNWRQIEEGRSAPNETLAHMAYIAGVDPEQLAEYRPEAAAILREISRQEQSRFEAQSELEERLKRITADRERREMLEKFTEAIDPGDHAG